jgi:hypothetical protein
MADQKSEVYVCYQCSYDFCQTWRDMQHIFANEIDALNWTAEFTPVTYSGAETEWREYDTKEVE